MFEIVDLTPIIENYAKLLWPSSKSPTWVYILDLNSNPYRYLANLLNLRVGEVTKTF